MAMGEVVELPHCDPSLLSKPHSFSLPVPFHATITEAVTDESNFIVDSLLFFLFLLSTLSLVAQVGIPFHVLIWR